jgi:hypothetical protein
MTEEFKRRFFASTAMTAPILLISLMIILAVNVCCGYAGRNRYVTTIVEIPGPAMIQ